MGTGEVDPVTASFVTGRLRRTLSPLELWVDEVFESATTISPEEPEPREFRIPLPELCFDGQQHTVEVRAGSRTWSQQFQSAYDGFIDPFSHNLISGWIIDLSRPNLALDVEILVNARLAARVSANKFQDHLALREGWLGFNGFSYQIPETPEQQQSFIVRARVAGTDIDLQGSPALSIATPRLFKAAQQLNYAFGYLEQRLMWTHGGRGPELTLTPEERSTFASLLLEGTTVADVLELRRRFLAPIQQQLMERYARRDYSYLGRFYPDSVTRRPRGSHRDRPVDIIIPVYAGVAETRRCLESVLRSPAGCSHEVLCVLDNPRDKSMRRLLQSFSGRVTILKNERTLGFAESVNRALRVHRDRDAVLLHADCEVHGDWLLRLQEASYAGAGAGMVNPFSDHSEYFSYPGPLEAMDRIAKRVNSGVIVPIPAAMAFCLYLRRGCLDDLGFFHNDGLDGGYYAEKYFSINAAAYGWRSVLAADVFVRHSDFVAFTQQSIERARKSFEQWCPFFLDTVTDFRVDDPTLPQRRELDVARLESLQRDFFCFVTHSLGGGTERHIVDLRHELDRSGVGSLVLYALPEQRVHLDTAQLQGIESLTYRLDSELPQLVAHLKRLRVHHLHFHSNVGVHPELFRLPGMLDLPYDVTVHDYAWFCPRINLINASGMYCGEPPVSTCETCVGGGVAALRDQSQRFLQAARRVFCPSEDARDRMARQFGLENLVLRRHPERLGAAADNPTPVSAGETVTVATLGRLSEHKGLQVLRQCAAHALEGNLALRFVVIGEAVDPARLASLSNVEITGPYQEQEIDGLLLRHGVHVALLPCVWPETYSYTLSIAMRAGLGIVAFDLGAIAERLREAGTGTLLPLGASPADINAALIQEAQRHRARNPVRRGTGYPDILRDYYGLTNS